MRARPHATDPEQCVFDKLSFEHAIDVGGDLTDNFVKGTFDELYASTTSLNRLFNSV